MKQDVMKAWGEEGRLVTMMQAILFSRSVTGWSDIFFEVRKREGCHRGTGWPREDGSDYEA